jgi:UbiD family decarboxylase
MPGGRAGEGGRTTEREEMDLRSFLVEDLVVEEAVDPDLEIAGILYENPEKTVLFPTVKGSRFRCVGNLITSRERLCEAIGTDRDRYLTHISRVLNDPLETVTVERGLFQEEQAAGLGELPLLRHFPGDGGKYITSGIVVVEDPEMGRNASIHRLMVKGEMTLGIRIVERHLHRFLERCEKEARDLEVAIAIGLHPAILYAASYPAPPAYDEFRIASRLLESSLEMARCRTVDIEVPAAAEVVIEGRIPPGRREPEGPFVDVTGTYDWIREEPVIEVTRISHRRDPLYHALLPSSREHRLLMGMPRECGIYEAVREVAEVKNVCLTEGGSHWLHGVVSLRKKREEDGREAILRAFEGHKSMKHVVIVDEDIDIFDPLSVEFAIATRFQADRDAVILEGVKGSSLDPSSGKTGLTAKVGLDATKPLDRLGDFERAPNPRPPR